MTKITFQCPVEFGAGEKTIEFHASFGYNGIGSYEFWGAKCYDRGDLEMEDITCSPTEDAAFNAALEELLNDFFDFLECGNANAVRIMEAAADALAARIEESNKREIEWEEKMASEYA